MSSDACAKVERQPNMNDIAQGVEHINSRLHNVLSDLQSCIAKFTGESICEDDKSPETPPIQGYIKSITDDISMAKEKLATIDSWLVKLSSIANTKEN